jgi:hypothetical protein
MNRHANPIFLQLEERCGESIPLYYGAEEEPCNLEVLRKSLDKQVPQFRWSEKSQEGGSIYRKRVIGTPD